MKKKLLLFLLILIVGLCPIVFVACGGVSGENISLSFSGNIEDNVVYLTVGDEENGEKDLTVKINNYTDSISRNLSFVSDSTSISISKPTYYNDGSAKVKLTAVHGGTAYITVTTEQFSKQATIKVVVKENLKDFTLKNDVYEIYYEKDSGDLNINLEDYFDFSPKTATEKTLLAYDGSECLTRNGITEISNLIEDTSLTIVSPNVAGKSVSLLVKVVEKLESEQISLKKSTYLSSGNISFVDFEDGGVITLLKNNNAANTISKNLSTESCYLKVAVSGYSKNIEINPAILTKQDGNWVENKHILAEEITSGDLVYGLGENEHIFKISYAGEDEMKIVFAFKESGYTYDVKKEIFVTAKEAPSNISINGESLKTYNYTIYTTSNTYVGKKLKFNIFPENSASYKAYLCFNETSKDALVVRNNHGILSGKKIEISNGEEVRVSAVDNSSFEKNQTVTLKVEFTFENINFEFEVTLNFEIKKAPSAVKVVADGGLNGENSENYQSLSQVYLDINGSGKRIDADGHEIVYDGTNMVNFYVYGVVDGKLESGHAFTVKNNTNVVGYKVDEDGKVTVFASQVGTGSLTISFETGEKISVKFQVVNSVSEFGIVFPNPSQNSNIVKVESEDELKVTLLTNKKIYVSKNIVGDYQNLTASCQFDGEQIVSFKDGYFEVKKDTNEFVNASISFKYSYIQGGTTVSQDVNYEFKILSLTKVSKFNLTTNKSSTNFSLYDFSSVGFYSQNLATAVITLNIEPVSLRSTLISNVDWLVNGTPLIAKENDDENIDEYNYDNLFTLRYNKTTGVATILCDTKNFEGDIPDKIILQAQTVRSIAGMKVETLKKSVSFSIVENVPIEKIETSVDEITIDKYNNKASVYTSVFPIDASNKNLDILFIPNDIKNKNAVKITKNSENFEIELQSGYDSGSGKIRIIAVDSYTDSTNFKTYVDIPLTICDGTEEYPYVITNASGLQILKDTEFKKYYKISGEIDFLKYSGDWQLSTETLKGHIIGVNNAKIINIKVENLKEFTISDTTKYYAGLFKEIDAEASIENISFVGTINIKTTKENGEQSILDECNIGLIAGQNNGTIKNVFARLGESESSVTSSESSVTSSGSYTVNLGGLFGQNHGNITTTISTDYNYFKVVEINKLTFIDNSSPITSHTLLIGGVAGYNDGTISKVDNGNIVEVNNSQTTADVNIFVISEYKNEVGDLKHFVSNVVNENEAIGGIFGYSSGAISNLTAIGEICAGEIQNNNFVGYFNNVGGLVGYNSAGISDSISQVFVRGNQNIGGLVGSQVGGILTLNKVQALEKASGINSALIIGKQNVGGLVGYAGSQSGNITKNAVISYVSKNISSLSTENAEYYGNILCFSSSTCNVGRIVAVDGSGAFEQNVAICDINGDLLNVYDETISVNNAFFGYVQGAIKNYVSSDFINNLCDDEAYTLEVTTLEDTEIITLEEFIKKVKAAGNMWCSELYERYISGYNGTQVNVKYDDCNPFGMIAGDFGEIASLSKHTSKKASDSTIASFNTLSELFATFMGNFEIPTNGTEYIPTISSDALNNYTTFYNKAIELYDSSLVSFTKNISNNLTRSAVVGVNYPYTMAFGTDVSPEFIDFQTVIANLFGFSSKSEFMNYAKNLANTYAEYRTSIANSLTANEALNNGCFYTSNGSFVFPIAVKNELSSTVLAYVILDTSGLVSVWVNDITATLMATNFNASYHTDSIINNELYCKNILFITGPEKTAVDFIILPPTQITITLTGEGEKNKLKSEAGSDLVFYLYYHQKLDEAEQYKFNGRNTYQISDYIKFNVNSNTPLVVTSNNEDVVKIINGDFEIVSTGVAKIIITSEFNKTLKEEFYIYAVNYVSNFDLFLNADKNSNQLLTNSSPSAFDIDLGYMLYFNYLDKFNVNDYSLSSQIKVAILLDNNLLLAGNSLDLINFFGISYDAYQISFANIINSKLIKFIPYYEVSIDGKLYTTLFNNEGTLNEIELSGIQITIKVEKQTKSISSNQTDAVVMPIYTAVFDIAVDTEKTDEVLEVKQLELIDGVYQITNNLEIKVSLTETDGKYEVDNKNFKIYVSLKDEYKNLKENAIYKIELISSNNKKCELNVTFKPQVANNVDVYFYNLESKVDGKENFSYISTNKIVPGVAGLFEFLIVPNYSDYEYIEISNLNTNAYNIVFENLYKREDSSVIQVITRTINGFKISKSILESLKTNGRFSVRAVLDERISDGEVVSFVVDIYGKNGEKVYKTTRYDFYAEHLPGVKISVDGVVNTTETEKLKVAVGKTYNLELNVKGFATGSSLQFNNSTNTYTDGEIVLKFNQNENLLKLEKVDGKYKLIVTSETNFESRFVTIKAYGEKITANGTIRSAEYNFYIEVVHFIVKTNENNLDIILDFNDGIHRSAVGDEFTFEVSLNDEILIYDKSNAVIASEVEKFLQDLSSYLNYSIKDATGYYSGWQSFSSLDNANKRANGAMIFTVVDNKLVVKFNKLERTTNPSCFIKFEKYVYYNNDGVPTVSDEDNDDILISQTNLQFEVTEKTSLTNPYPIYKVEEFMNMVAGNYYILMDDITLPNNFTGISTLIGGFDGNNHNIILPNSLQVENAGGNTTYNFAIFRTIAEGALFSNIRIQVNLTRVDLTEFNSINFGVLAVNNYGIITNCAVVGTNYNSRIEVLNQDISDSAVPPESNISAFVVNNYGAISNSRVEISIKGKGNIAGFVYENNGSIASSFVYGTVVNETTSTSSITAGFVANNNYDALIFTSYITGDYEEKYLHQTNTKVNTPFATADENSSNYKIISSSHRLATFVYSNSGKISNCYANIPVSSSAVMASGFVFTNESSGEISYSYSTSKMSNLTSGHTVFIGRTSDGLQNKGKIIECFAVEDVILDLGEDISGAYIDSNITFMNYKLGSNSGIDGLDIVKNKVTTSGGITIKFNGTSGNYITVQEQFASASLFSKYALSTDASRTNAVWFFPASETQAEYRLTDGESYTGYKKLVVGRPELVSPNLLVYGQQTFKKQTYNEATGETIYEYNTASNIGEISNPIIIYDVNSLEAIADVNGYNIGENRYYRLISDVRYNSGTTSSKLYKYYFLGNLEGNCFSISNYVLDSSENLQSAGFFAGIGNAIKQKGSIKNVTFAPRYINLPNANAVGAVAGSVYGANIINVNVDGFENDYEGIVILGKNLVGGVVGYATGSYIFNNITSNISTNATYRASLDEKDVTINFNVYNANSVSFAGLIAGAVTGNGKIDYVYSIGNNVSIAECAGLVFGFAGENVVASNIYVNSSQNQIVKADIYGGVVVAVSSAKLNVVRVVDNNSRNSFFAQSVYTPKAVGNIVGFMIGGEINDATATTKTILPSSIDIVGGAVGIMETGKLTNVVITGDIRGGAHVGGLIGYAGEVETNGYSKDIEFKPIANPITINNSYLVGSLTSNSSKSNVSIGTLVGLTTIAEQPTGTISLGTANTNINISLTSPSEVKKYLVYFNNYSFETNIVVAYGTIIAYYEKDQTKQTYSYDANDDNYDIENKFISYVITPTVINGSSNS